MWTLWLTIALVRANEAPPYTGSSGKCLMSFPTGGFPRRKGCGKNSALSIDLPNEGLPVSGGLLNNAPCYEPDGVAPQKLEGFSVVERETFESICPNFVQSVQSGSGTLCCNGPQVLDMKDKFDQMYTAFFQECPACLRSQLEYYCTLYCSAGQSETIEIQEVFTHSSGDLGVQKFDAKFQAQFLNDMYDSCKTVKQVWFDNVLPELGLQIPKYSTTLVENRFCRESSTCDGETWLQNQGMANGTWPRFGALNTVSSIDPSDPDYTDSDYLTSHVHDCTETLEVYPPTAAEDGTVETKSCGCFNCVQECPNPEEIVQPLTDRTKYPVDRSPGNCLLYPSCGKNLVLPNGEGQGRNDVPCLATESRPAYVWSDDNDDDKTFLTLLKSVCPLYVHNTGDGKTSETCCNFEQLNTLYQEIGQLRQLFSRCPSCMTNAIHTFCHSTCYPSQTEFMAPIEGFTTEDSDRQEAIGLSEVHLYFDGNYMDDMWNSCKDVTFPQTNGKVIEGLMCDGKTGDQCTVEVWLNFQGATSNGFAPYDLVYIKVVNSTTDVTGSFRDRWKQPQLRIITQDELEKIEPGMTPLTFPTTPCNEGYTDEFSKEEFGACSCQDCETSCPPLPVYPEPEPRPTVGNMDMWGFIAVMIGTLLVVVFLVALVVRKHVKTQYRTEDVNVVTAARTNSVDTENIKSVSVEDVTCLDKIGFASSEYLRKGFQWWAKNVPCRFPLTTLLFSFGWSAALIVGFKDIEFTTDPIVLWAAESSRSFQEYKKYNEYFVPFYRASQVIATLKPELQKPPTNYSYVYGGEYAFDEILNVEHWRELYDLSLRVRDLKATYEWDGEEKAVNWADVCFNPLDMESSDDDSPAKGVCTLFSVFQYFQNDWDNIVADWFYTDKEGNKFNTTYKDHFLYCTKTPSSLHNKLLVNEEEGINNGLPCGSDFGSPVFPYLAVGGYNSSLDDYWTGQALILSFINRNVEDTKSEAFARVLAWEDAFLNIMQSVSDPEHPKYDPAGALKNFDVAFFSERSIEDEIDSASQSDVIIFVISYVVIFIYIMIALGKYSTCRRVPIDMKVSLAIGGILIILASALAATGVFGWAGVASNLIVMEVVPFLLLAVGADNVFILVMDIQREPRSATESNSDVIARVFGRGGPSMLLCALTESTVFFVGSVSEMPAVKVFAINAGLAIVFNFILQITAFIAVVKLDMDRHKANRWDVLFIKSSAPKPKPKVSFIDTFFRKYYAPFLMNDLIGFAIICSFCAWLGGSIYAVSIATVGLDQKLSVPKDSYVADYFEAMETYLMVGVPVYFVLEGKFKYDEESFRNLVCGSSGCNPYSLAEQISRAAEQPQFSKLETPATVWVDDYVDWIKPSSGCCRTFRTKDCIEYGEDTKCAFCAADENAPILGQNSCKNCIPLLSMEENEDGNSEIVSNTTITSKDFKTYLDYFLDDNPNEFCSKGGHASYGDAINYEMRNESAQYEYINAAYFMAYHSVCIKSVECQENIEQSRLLADNITRVIRENIETINEERKLLPGDDDYTDPGSIQVWTYAIYYPYYEQYITLPQEAMFQIGICLIPAFAFTFVLLGFDVVSGLIVIATVTMIVVDTLGMCTLWGVDFNALTLINLISAIGLSIEFTAHTTRAFALNTKATRKARLIDTMGTMGPAVLMGVAFTNLPGIICLHWAQMQIIEIFFFRMCFVMTLVGIAHGLIFLPVILAYFGPTPNRALLLKTQKELAEQLKVRKSRSGTNTSMFKSNYKSSPRPSKLTTIENSSELEPRSTPGVTSSDVEDNEVTSL